MSIFKKIIPVEREFYKCDFCDENDYQPEMTIPDKVRYEIYGKSNTYIKTCPGCGKQVCPNHRKRVEEDVELCLNCSSIWNVIMLYNSKFRRQIK